jgi:hypothetical protein
VRSGRRRLAQLEHDKAVEQRAVVEKHDH